MKNIYKTLIFGLTIAKSYGLNIAADGSPELNTTYSPILFRTTDRDSCQPFLMITPDRTIKSYTIIY